MCSARCLGGGYCHVVPGLNASLVHKWRRLAVRTRQPHPRLLAKSLSQSRCRRQVPPRRQTFTSNYEAAIADKVCWLVLNQRVALLQGRLLALQKREHLRLVVVPADFQLA